MMQIFACGGRLLAHCHVLDRDTLQWEFQNNTLRNRFGKIIYYPALNP